MSETETHVVVEDDFDVSSLDTLTTSQRGVAMPILHPKTGRPIVSKAGTEMSITLRGPGSSISEDINKSFAVAREKFRSRGVEMTAEDLERERFTLLCAVTVDWTFTRMDGKPFPCTKENIERFWTDPRWAWVQFQAWGFCQNEGNYLPL